MAKKALILYASRSGNTEKIALKFKEVIERKGAPWGDWECDALKVHKHTDVHNPPFDLKDYNLLCIGSLIANGIPVPEIFDDHLGIAMPQNLFKDKNERFGALTQGYRDIKGIAFVTYGGTRWGPPEAIPSLDLLALRMEDMRIRCIGKFACTGGGPRKWRHAAPDIVAARYNWTVEQADEALNRYKENPNYPEFADLSEEDRKMFADEIAAGPGPRPEAGTRHGWRWDSYDKPNERDLEKAQIFMEEILEDYYGGGLDAAPMAQYVCIS